VAPLEKASKNSGFVVVEEEFIHNEGCIKKVPMGVSLIMVLSKRCCKESLEFPILSASKKSYRECKKKVGGSSGTWILPNYHALMGNYSVK